MAAKPKPKPSEKRKPVRPASKTMPPYIPDTPENVARAVLAPPADKKK